MNEPLLIVSGILAAGLALIVTWFVATRFLRRCPRMMPLPVQSMFVYCTLFTVGIALLSTRASLLVAFGLVFAFIGVAMFLPETVVIRLTGLFLLLLCVALLSVLNQLRVDAPMFQPRPLTVWSASAFAMLWGLGILFAWRRWSEGRASLNE
jgi:hypothetical protein